MRRYLQQLACVLRPGSVSDTDLALRSFAAFLAEHAPEVTRVADVVSRRHIEDYKPWLAARPGQNKPGSPPRRIGAPARHAADVLRPHRRVGLARSAGPGADVPRRPAPPGPPAAQGPRRRRRREAAARRPGRRRRCWSGSPWKCCCAPDLRVSEFTALAADAVVQIGAAPWLHVPVGKLHEDRYLPLHPHLVTLIDDYRSAPRPAGSTRCCCPGENGRPLDRHTVTRI